MYRIIRNSYIILAWLYGSFIFSWLALHTLFGDQIWWLALINIMTPYLFLPLLPLIIASVLYRTSAIYIPVVSVTLTFLTLYGQQFPFHRLELIMADKPTIRIMSFNIWGGSRSAETAQVIEENGWPDVVALQELTPSMAAIINEVAGEQYPFRILDIQNGRLGMGIYSRYPLIELVAKQTPDPAWQVQIVKVYANDRSFVLYNVHPHATNVYLYLEQGVSMADTVRASYQSRLVFVHQLMDDMDRRNEPAIIAGDFNSTDQSDVYKVLTSHVTDAYRDAGWGFGHTFPAYSASFQEIPPLAKLAEFVYAKTIHFLPRYYLNSLRLVRIDMILHSQEFRAIDSHVSSVHGESDHLPVLATLQWVK
jgi:vancomycin resistance protein VanJ